MASKAIGFLNFKFGADLKPFQRAMNKAQKGLKKFGKSVERTGKNLTTGLTLPIVALGAASLKTFADFEQGMLKVKAVSGATKEEFKALTDSAKELGSATMFSASQVSGLQFELSKLGLTPDEINKATGSILALAQATTTDLAESARIVAVALNSYNLSADETTRVSDVMALASSSAAIDMEKFGAALPKVAATARISGDSFEEMTAKLQILADSGMEGARMGTQLKIMYSKLAEKGLTWDNAMGKIQKSSKKLATAQEIFGTNAANAAIILSENTTKLNEYKTANINAAGTSKELADIMDSGIGGSMRKMKSQLEGVAIELGEKLIPIFEIGIDKISKMVKFFTSLSDQQQKSIVKWGLIFAAVGPILIIFGKLSLGLSSLVGAFKTVGGFLISNPWIVLASAVALVAFKIYDYTTRLSEAELVQNSINRVTKNAIASTLTQTKKIKDLTSVINSENTSLTEKETALNNLKKISPEYYNTFSTIEGNINAITKATKDLTAELLLNAKITSAQSELSSLFERGADDLGSFKTFQYYMETGRIAAGTPLLDAGPEDIRAADNTISQINAITDLLSQWETKQNSLTSSIKSTNIVLKETNGTIETTNDEVEKTTKSFENFQSSIQETAIVWDTYAQSMSNAEDQFEGIVFWQTELTDNQKLLNAGVGMF